MCNNRIMWLILKFVAVVVALYFTVGIVLNFNGTCPAYLPPVDLKNLTSEQQANQKQLWQTMFCPFIKSVK